MELRRKGFTLIEVLVSVVLISVVILGIVRIRDQQVAAAHYLDSRMRGELSNTLFLTDGIARYDGKKKSAYDLLKGMRIQKDATRRILETQRRSIRVDTSDPIPGLPVPLRIRKIVLKGEFSSRYYRLDF